MVVVPAGVSGNSWGATGLISINTLPEVPAGGIASNKKRASREGIALAQQV